MERGRDMVSSYNGKTRNHVRGATILSVEGFVHAVAAMQRSSSHSPRACLKSGPSLPSGSKEPQTRPDNRRGPAVRRQSTQAYNTYEPEGATVRFSYSKQG